MAKKRLWRKKRKCKLLYEINASRPATVSKQCASPTSSTYLLKSSEGSAPEMEQDDHVAKTGDNHNQRYEQCSLCGCTIAVLCEKWMAKESRRKGLLKTDEEKSDFSMSQTINEFYDYPQTLPVDRTNKQHIPLWVFILSAIAVLS